MSISSYTDCFHYTNLLLLSSIHLISVTFLYHILFLPPELHLFYCFLISKKFLGYLTTFSSGQLSSFSQYSFWESSIWSTPPVESQQLNRDGAPQSLSCLPLTPSGFTYICSASLFTDCCCYYGMMLESR